KKIGHNPGQKEREPEMTRIMKMSVLLISVLIKDKRMNSFLVMNAFSGHSLRGASVEPNLINDQKMA
ncbi:hypothetical protein SNEBB_008290, partial [Seison nebaliae]